MHDIIWKPRWHGNQWAWWIIYKDVNAHCKSQIAIGTPLGWWEALQLWLWWSVMVHLKRPHRCGCLGVKSPGTIFGVPKVLEFCLSWEQQCQKMWYNKSNMIQCQLPLLIHSFAWFFKHFWCFCMFLYVFFLFFKVGFFGMSMTCISGDRGQFGWLTGRHLQRGGGGVKLPWKRKERDSLTVIYMFIIYGIVLDCFGTFGTCWTSYTICCSTCLFLSIVQSSKF